MKDKNLTSFSDHLDLQYGKPGTESRKKYEEEFEVFKNRILLQEFRKKGLNLNKMPNDPIKLLNKKTLS
jgi:hypothetical protein